LIVVATKLDATTDRVRLETLRDFCKQRELEFHSISAVAGEGVKELVRSIADALEKIPRPAPESSGDSPSSVPENEEDSQGNEVSSAPIRFERSALAASEDEDS
jgi:GTPase involved in cell partitioning and DNA repair